MSESIEVAIDIKGKTVYKSITTGKVPISLDDIKVTVFRVDNNTMKRSIIGVK